MHDYWSRQKASQLSKNTCTFMLGLGRVSGLVWLSPCPILVPAPLRELLFNSLDRISDTVGLCPYQLTLPTCVARYAGTGLSAVVPGEVSASLCMITGLGKSLSAE